MSSARRAGRPRAARLGEACPRRARVRRRRRAPRQRARRGRALVRRPGARAARDRIPHATPRLGRRATRRRVHVPADRLGDVPRLLVLGEQESQRAPERRMKRRDEKRKRGLGHPRVRGKRVDERDEALAGGELLDEPGNRCLRRVHAAGGTGVPQGDRSARNRLAGALASQCGRAPSGEYPNTPRGTPVSLLVP